jgi:hypothetical protein
LAIGTDSTLERRASARFARNVALSLSGGALLTVLGATAAHAQDAGTASDGAGSAHSGDATAVGNRSGSNTTQNGTSGAGGSVQVGSQTGVIANVGVAVADTGGNTAVGNSSDNTVTNTQVGSGGLIATSNNGSAANSSNGAATISTGDATATGNQSTTTLSQGSGTAGNGALGGVLIVSQNGLVLNSGVAQASTGGNTATGNDSDNTASLLQNASAAGLGLATNSGRAANASNGLATVNTGAATATGNQSDTKVTQSSNGDAGDDPGGLLLVTQAAVVLNNGSAEATTGDNSAIGVVTDSHADLSQGAEVDEDALALLALASNSADVSNSADGTAHIRTGAATATGNQSATDLDQSAEGTADGVAPLLQAALVLNTGEATANTGDNEATGNESEPGATAGQTALVGGNGSLTAGQAIASNSADLSNSSDGTASISTGAATATGNTSRTEVDQTIDPSGLVLNPQLAAVVSSGSATALTGTNVAIGNFSGSQVSDTQFALVGGDNDLVAGQAIASTSLSGSNVSDGTTSIDTGAAWASGNESDTRIAQTSNGAVDGLGLIVTPQVAFVDNEGTAGAFTGSNFTTGNNSSTSAGGAPQARTAFSPAGSTVTAASAIASSSASFSNQSDGTAEIRTGSAKATGNHSSTDLAQTSDATVSGLGAIVAPQVGVVVNQGEATALTGNNSAYGNNSTSSAGGSPVALAASPTVAGQDLLVVGPLTASSSIAASNASDGTGRIGTGKATAEGNRSSTTLHQDSDPSVDGLGLILAPQIGAVVNQGDGDANSGENVASGNESFNDASVRGSAELVSGNPPYSGTIIGPATASASADVSNRSDGEACVCTGDATASGNIAETTLLQDVDPHVAGGGTLVVTEAALVLNLGEATADSGHNEATGNSSTNTASGASFATINDALLPFPVVGPQTASTSLSGGNTSDGTAKVGSGRATAIGNDSTTVVEQAAAVDGGFAVASLTGVTANVGQATATSGDNSATGNDSVNDVDLFQNAEGAGVVANSGEFTNDSDGTAQIGNPDCEPETPAPGQPGAPGLPRTGGPIEAEAAIALMLLLVGFGLTRRCKALA